MSATAEPTKLALDFDGPDVDRSIVKLTGSAFIHKEDGSPLELTRLREIHVQVIDTETGEVIGNAYGKVVRKAVSDKELKDTDDDGALLIESTLEHTVKLT